MEPELQKYYEDLFDLFLHPGWKHLIEDFTADQERIENIRNVTDSNGLYFNQGKLLILDRFIQFEENAKKAYDELLVPEADNAHIV